MVSSRVMGTPSAVPLISPKLDRMSLRTMSLSVSTLGPLEPSPGYGPAVSSGISATCVGLAAAAALDDEENEEGDVDAAEDGFAFDPHAARNAATPAPAMSFKARLRS